MISDALAGHAHGPHEATLATFYRIFGDVRPSGEIIELLNESGGRDVTAEEIGLSDCSDATMRNRAGSRKST